MTPAEALAILRESRDADRDARIWADGGKRIAALARVAGVRVTFASVELGTVQTVEYRTVTPGEVGV